MSFLFSFFRKNTEDDYETVLSLLAVDIQKRQTNLADIRLRERRSTLLVTLYTFVAWVVYVTLWYTGALPSLSGYYQNLRVEKAVKGLPVVVGPIIILFIRRIVQIWYTRKGDAEEKTLQNLMKERRTKVEEIKKKTNYYSTWELLQRYDENSPASSPLRQRIVAQPQGSPSTPTRPISNAESSALNTPQNRAIASPQPPPGPSRKQWYDKLADAVLGDDDQARFALICEQCFAHNGLVKESVWEDTQYVCPKCNHFNASRRSKKQDVRPPPQAVGPRSPVTHVIPPMPPHASQKRQVSPTQEPREPVEPESNLMEVDHS
ncbi:uncharacterized protein BT62DRAFT_930854 [Guyanagaster necrorhizus]|uniref:Endoplasmic reticulum junction formation protein lunapark n=1 Tax=Guyanagaster necrorhizus TaxID=856835 RepID=A0A9P7VWN4_9AGAR|nr:uncharacterized protein BT62DRAFT_930854 [Guyanagaster necrorhizus MCA 3950]KAG7447810.1 hypothetical protein BT62DRAFT_930854 [Guyanagaster necrorhizus MCA 3950]